MEMKVEVLSKEIIKPALPTRHDRRKLMLSFLDQVAPGIYTPFIFFYPFDQLRDATVDHSERNAQLKNSLSLVLTHFYPLAGTIVDGCSVDCDDGGVEYSEAQVSCTLSEVVDEPELNRLLQLLPFKPSSADEPGCDSRQLNLAVRYSIFSCGGISIAICITHKLCDGISATNFLMEWAATSRGVTDVVEPSFDAAKLFPPTDLLGFRRRGIQSEKVLTKRFVFSESNITALREKIAGSSDGGDSLDKPPTRVEAISAFIWKRFMTIARSKQNKIKIFAATQAVNLRGRMDPPLPVHSVGNLWWHTIASTSIDNEENYQYLVSLIRKSIKSIDSEMVKGLQNVEKTLETMKKAAQRPNSGEIEFCSFTSWCHFPLYETEFGWGKPSWVSSPGIPYKNVVILKPTGTGNGIEACVNFEEDVMTSFVRDPELLAFTSS